MSGTRTASGCRAGRCASGAARRIPKTPRAGSRCGATSQMAVAQWPARCEGPCPLQSVSRLRWEQPVPGNEKRQREIPALAFFKHSRKRLHSMVHCAVQKPQSTVLQIFTGIESHCEPWFTSWTSHLQILRVGRVATICVVRAVPGARVSEVLWYY